MMGGEAEAGLCAPIGAKSILPIRRVVAATYNIHRCIGTDGRYSPARTAAVIEELEADIIGLQEVDTRLSAGRSLDQLTFLARRLGFHAAAGLNIAKRRGHYGNALLSRWPIDASRLIDLTVPGREPRGAVDAEVRLPESPAGAVLRVIITHLGLRGWERRQQIKALLAYLDPDADPAQPLLVMGDFNEWLRFGPISRSLLAALICGRSVGSFPARCPLLPLDRICSRSMMLADKPRRHVSAPARLASDHLPVRAILGFGNDAASRSNTTHSQLTRTGQ
jgi:endonuclease/exonuclease/phosphatase family metal-dependent hydrolase